MHQGPKKGIEEHSQIAAKEDARSDQEFQELIVDGARNSSRDAVPGENASKASNLMDSAKNKNKLPRGAAYQLRYLQ